MKVLVTGISGLVGQLVARRLSRQGHTVVGIDRRRWRDAPEGVEVHAFEAVPGSAEDAERTARLAHEAKASWTAVDGYWGSYVLTLDQLFVCEKGKSKRVGYPGAVRGTESASDRGATRKGDVRVLL